MSIVDVLTLFLVNAPVLNLTAFSTDKHIVDSSLVKFGWSIGGLKVSYDFLSSCLQINDGNFDEALVEI